MRVIKSPRFSYRKQLLVYLMLGGLLPLLLASAMILYAAGEVYENMQAKSGRAEVQRISREIDTLVSNYERLMNPLLVGGETVAFLRGSRENVEEIYGSLYAILAGHAGEAALYLLSADGRQVIATDDVPHAYALPENLDWGLLGQASRSRDWVASAADKYAADRSEVVFSLARAIRRGDELLGFAVIDIKREALVPLIQRVQEGREGRIILTDRYQYVMLNMQDYRSEGRRCAPRMRCRRRRSPLCATICIRRRRPRSIFICDSTMILRRLTICFVSSSSWTPLRSASRHICPTV